MTHKDGSTFCNFCGRHESQVTFLVEGQKDTHICDCCAWECTMIICERIREQRQEKAPDGISEKPSRPDVYIFADAPDDTTENEENRS